MFPGSSYQTLAPMGLQETLGKSAEPPLGTPVGQRGDRLTVPRYGVRPGCPSCGQELKLEPNPTPVPKVNPSTNEPGFLAVYRPTYRCTRDLCPEHWANSSFSVATIELVRL